MWIVPLLLVLIILPLNFVELFRMFHQNFRAVTPLPEPQNGEEIQHIAFKCGWSSIILSTFQLILCISSSGLIFYYLVRLYAERVSPQVRNKTYEKPIVKNFFPNYTETFHTIKILKSGGIRITPWSAGWHVAQWISRAPPQHTLPAFLNLNGTNKYL